MNKVLLRVGNGIGRAARAHGSGGWQRWAPFAAVAWSLIYGALGIYWAASGREFPYPAESLSDPLGPLVGRFGLEFAWAVVMMAGIPAAVVGVAMLGGWRALRGALIAAGALLAGVLLLFMADLTLLETLGYVPFTIFRFVTGGDTSFFLKALANSTAAHQLFCLIGGFLWLAATVSYARLSSDACLYCGRRDGPEGWQAPEQAALWGRIATYVAMAVPIFYALTRYAWALGIPLGMTVAHWRSGQERGMWVAGLFLANFGLVGAVLMLGLVQRWGETFPRWMIGLAGRRVPIALAVVPAAIISVVLVVGGTAIWTSLGQMLANAVASGSQPSEMPGIIVFEVGPTLLFPLWGAALAVATLGYYFRRRGPCKVCGRGSG